jgi:hypothetical protein
MSGDEAIFVGDNQKERYYTILKGVINGIDIKIDLGAIRSELGTHSIRKTADSYGCNMPNGPPQAVVMARAGHPNGKIIDCYHKVDAAGDCFCGRVLTGISLMNENFAVLPPHFHPDGLNIIEELGWNNILDYYDQYPPSFQRVLPYLLVTLIYHHYNGNLQRLLPNEHPLFKQKLFTTYMKEFKIEHVLLGINEYVNINNYNYTL